jgi:hypothetical protein
MDDPLTKHELTLWIRSEFNQTRRERDLNRIKHHLSHGNLQLKQVQSMVSLNKV